MPSAQIAPTIATASASPTTKPSSSASESEIPRSPKKRCRSCARPLNSAPSRAPSNAVEPIAVTSSATVPATGASLAAPVKGTRRTRRPSSPRPIGASEAEQPEEDAERVGVAHPRLDAVEAHPDEHHHEVDEHQQRQRAGLAGLGPAQLADREREQPDGGRPAAEALGVVQRLGQRAGAVADQADAAADRPPRAQQPEDVAEQQRGERDADPEADVDHRRREVRVRPLGAEQARVDGDEEDEDAECAEQDLDARGRPKSRFSGSRRQPRLRPAERERDERHDQHGRAGGGEQRDGDREVGAPDDPVREQEHAPSLGTHNGPADAGPS